MVRTLVRRVVGILAIGVLISSALPASAQAALKRDCGPQAVIYCGAATLDELKADYRANQGGNVDDIFAYFNIPNEAALNGMVDGRVTKSGEVFVGSQKVAGAAITAGRKNLPGSTPILGGQAFTRPPSVSFKSDSLDAFVKMVNGRFQFAVIKSCGNPVKATPVPPPARPRPPVATPKKPNLSIKKQVRIQAGTELSEFQDDTIDAKEGDLAQYWIRITNTGETDLKNVHIQDSLPRSVTFNDDAEVLGSGVEGVEDPSVQKFVSQGITVASIAKGSYKDFMFTVVLDDEAGEPEACRTLKNIARAKADDVTEKQDDADVRVCEEAAPPTETPEQPDTPQVLAKKTPKILPVTGVGGVIGAFSFASVLGIAAYRLKDFYLGRLR